MADIVNLNKFRKSKDRAQKRQQADENAVRFGLSKTQKARDIAQVGKLHKDVDGHKCETDETKPKDGET